MNKRTKILIILSLAIVCVDILTKLLAFYVLPFNEQIFLIGDFISFYSTYNMDSTGSQIDNYYNSKELNKNYELFFLAIVYFLMAFSILYINFLKRIKKTKWLLLIPFFIIATFLVLILKIIFPDLVFSNYFISLFSKLSVLAVFIVLSFVIKEKWIRLFLICMISAGIGNLLSHFYYPFKVIDFIYIEGSYEAVKIGIFNIADLILYLSLISLIIYLIFFTIRKIIQRLTHSKLFK